MNVEHKPTFCRICEPLCGMIATVEDGRLTALRPDKDHPLSAGFACQKGVVIGANPVVSHGSALTVRRIKDRMHDIVKRGGRVLVVDPRKTETAAVYGRVGTSIGENGTLTTYLLDAVNLVAGNLDVAGGSMFGRFGLAGMAWLTDVPIRVERAVS